MTTRRTRATVSPSSTVGLALAGLALAGLALGGCAPRPSRPASEWPASMDARSLTIRFDNGGREHVHVYLVGRTREWLLGRVEPGAHATLRLPDASLGEGVGFVQLAVVTGAGRTLDAARDPRAMLTVAQPATQLLTQRWMLVQGQLASVPVAMPRAGGEAGGEGP